MSETLDKALKLFQERNYKEAIDAFQVVIENEDESAEIYNNIGVSYSNLGDYKSAENYLNKALKLDSTLPQIYLNMSDVYYRQKEIALAIECLRAGEVALPDNTVIPHYLARILMEDAQQDLAIDELDKILEKEPNNYDAYYDLGRIYFEMGNWDAAIDNFENILEFKDQNELIYFYLGEAYEANDEIDKAISNYLKATAVNDKFHPAFKKLGMLFMAREDFSDAIEYFEDYINFDIPEEEKKNIQNLIERIKIKKV
ncbi:MAG: tetratricopeptide repeat protein [Candidatus Gastranaerophilaceae bacterium]